MRLEVRDCKSEEHVWGEFGSGYDYTARWKEYWLHFESTTEKENFHSRVIALQPMVEASIEKRKGTLREIQQENYEQDLAKYQTELAAWKSTSWWHRLWYLKPCEPVKSTEKLHSNKIEQYILSMPKEAKFFYGPVERDLYEAIMREYVD
jgi:hypothetical protein